MRPHRMRDVKKSLVDGATVLTGLAAIMVAWVVLFGPGKRRIVEYRDEVVLNWEDYAVGHRLGPAGAPVKIILWTDFQCSSCKSLHSMLGEVIPKHGEDVALFVRHYPLDFHPLAYPAARAAECATHEGDFFLFQERLFETPNWLGDALVEFASDAGVKDLSEFRACIAGEDPVPSIERDIRAARALGARGTPAVLVNGVYLGRPPLDPTDLEEVIQHALSGQ